MKLLSQKNPLWASVKLGQSNLTIGNYGCLITSISMALSWYVETFKLGKWKDPEWMAKNLKFTMGGLFIWKSLDDSELPIKFVYRYYSRNDAKCLEILKSTYNVCILRVVLNGYQHWVFLINNTKKGFVIADPIDGKIRYLSEKYRTITGFAELTIKN